MLKQIMSLFGSIGKAKSLVIKSKTSATKARVVMFSLMRNKKALMGSMISNKINNFLGNGHQGDDDQQDIDNQDQRMAIVLYNAMTSGESQLHHSTSTYYDDDNKYPDLRHTLFDEEIDELEDEGGSIIDMVRNSKKEGGEEFSLEDEIDHVADLFITRFHKQMRMQKLLSFKRYQEMLERSV